MTQKFDAIVIGAGQAGPSMAGRLTAAGKTVAMIERNLFGGTCVNTGCKPTKTMVASAYAMHQARRAAEYGFASAGPITADMKRIKARKDQVTLDLARVSKAGWTAWKAARSSAATPVLSRRMRSASTAKPCPQIRSLSMSGGAPMSHQCPA